MDLHDYVPPSILTAADYEAADECIRRQPSPPADAELARRKIAAFHHRVGASRFRLLSGLREPDTCCEILELEVEKGVKPQRDFDEHVHQHIDADFNGVRLNKYATELEDRLAVYGEMLELLAAAVQNHPAAQDHEQVAQALDALWIKLAEPLTLYEAEVRYLPRILTEIRTEKDLGYVQGHGQRANTAAEYAVYFLTFLRDSWPEYRAREKLTTKPGGVPSLSAVTAFGQNALPHFAWTTDLLFLLREEVAFGKAALRSRRNGAPTSVTDEAATSAPEDSNNHPLFEVDRWEDLAIGIDKHWKYYGLVPAPRLGDVFVKSHSRQLDLRGEKRWPSLLELLAKSTDGHTTSVPDVVKAFGRLNMPSSLPRDGRARPGAIASAVTDELWVQADQAIKWLDGVLGDLRRELQHLIAGPSRRQACLRKREQTIDSVFVVAFLIPDDNGNLRFGQPRDE